MLASLFQQPQAMSRVGRVPLYFYNAPQANFGGFENRGNAYINRATPMEEAIRHESIHALSEPYLDELARYKFSNLDKFQSQLGQLGYSGEVPYKNVLTEALAYGSRPSGRIPGLSGDETNQLLESMLSKIKDQKFVDNYNRIRRSYNELSQ